MRHHLSRALLAVTLLVGASFATSADAAGTRIGGAFAGNAGCGSITVIQTGSPGNSYRVPADGVLTSFGFAQGEVPVASITLKVARASSAPSGFDIVGSSATVTGAGGQSIEASTRVLVRTGDVIGVYVGPTGGICLRTGAGAAYTYAFVSGEAPSGPLVAASTGVAAQADIAATWEPDADGDGFGDMSQDLCPTDKNTQAACGTGAPDTAISSLSAKKAKKASKKAAVTATFSASEASTFECAVDSAAFVPCASPYTTKLKVGTHSFAVRATDTAGNLDRTAAVKGFKVKVAKKK